MAETMTDFSRRFVSSFTTKLEPNVRSHLKNVYGCVCLSTLISGLAAMIGLGYPNFIIQPGLLTKFVGLVCLIGVMITRNKNKLSMQIRMGLLLTLSFCVGMNLVPLLALALDIEPSVVVTAILSTAMIFVSFSICALLSDGRWLYIGGPLISVFNTLTMFALFSLVFGPSIFIFHLYTYVGLFLMCGFVLYDTSRIIEKRRLGDDDFIGHSVDLFIDLIDIFRRILIILASREHARQQRQPEQQQKKKN